MNMVGKFENELNHAIQVRDMLMNTGGINIQPSVYSLNAHIRVLTALQGEYEACKKELDGIATSKQEFGSNRNAIQEHVSRLEQIEKRVATVSDAVRTLENNILKCSGIRSEEQAFGNVGVINNSVNAFPDCIPVTRSEMPNNLYLIKDKELEEYYVLETEFLEVCRTLYNTILKEGSCRNYATNVSKLANIIQTSEQIYATIGDLLDKKQYYNATCENIPVDSSHYDEYASYPETYREALDLIADIYNTNAQKFDEISRSL